MLCLYSFGQKTIKNPRFSATTAEFVKITKIELQDTVTIIDFEVTFIPKWWIMVSTNDTYIQDSNGGEKYYVKSADGIVLNERKWTPEDGVNVYTLYFPPLESKIKKIDFLEEQWKIFEIDLVGNEPEYHIPKELHGNWLTTDGSNEWHYGIYNDKVIYKNKIWNNIEVNKKGKTYELTLKEDKETEKIYLQKKNENLLIRDSHSKKNLYSRNITYKSNYNIKNNTEYDLSILHYDKAIYKGFINGYHHKMDEKIGIYVNDIIAGTQKEFTAKVEPDGSFQCEIPIAYPQEVHVRLLNTSDDIFLEPGKTLFHFIELSEFSNFYKTRDDWYNRDKLSLFMGDLAKINFDLKSMESINYFDYNKVQQEILEMSGNQFKEYCLDLMNKELEDINKFSANNKVSKKALQIIKIQKRYNTYEKILSFNQLKEYAYRTKHEVPRNIREIPLKAEIFEPEFYDFINPNDLNNPISLIAGVAYFILINRIEYSESVRPEYDFVHKKYEIPEIDPNTNKETVITIDSTFLQDPVTKELIPISGKDEYDNIHQNNLKKYFKLEKGFATDIMYAQKKCASLENQLEGFDDTDKQEIADNIDNDDIKKYILAYNDNFIKEIEEKVLENKAKTGYVINSTPEVDENLFEAIMEKYKGKIVLVDFWATWCGPCRQSMETIKPLKEEFKDKDVEFVYITNESSPLNTWSMMIPDITGEHYRVNQEQWSQLSKKFEISGIPHYTLVDKDGNVIKNKIYFASSNNEFRKMINDLLD